MTTTLKVQVPLPAIVALDKEMLPLPAVAVRVADPQPVVEDVVVLTVIAPGDVGRVSVTLTPETEVELELVKVKVSVEVPPAVMLAGEKALVMLTGLVTEAMRAELE